MEDSKDKKYSAKDIYIRNKETILSLSKSQILLLESWLKSDDFVEFSEKDIDDIVQIFELVPDLKKMFFVSESFVTKREVYDKSVKESNPLTFNMTENLLRKLPDSRPNFVLDMVNQNNITESVFDEFDVHTIRIKFDDLSKLPQNLIKQKNIEVYVHVKSFDDITPEQIDQYNITKIFSTNIPIKDEENVIYTGEQYKLIYPSFKDLDEEQRIFMQGLNTYTVGYAYHNIPSKLFESMPELASIYWVSNQRLYRKKTTVLNEEYVKALKDECYFSIEQLQNYPNSRPVTGLNLIPFESLDLEIIEKYKIESIKIQAKDLHKLPEEIREKIKLVVYIDNVTELSPKDIEKWKIEEIHEYYKNNCEDNENYIEDVYTSDEYVAIYRNLEELLSGIDLDMPERERAVEIYKRITENIIYDYPAGYPKTKKEQEYSDENIRHCRSMKNGLLFGKCVCAGYANILRNAYLIKGMEAVFVSGEVMDSIISENEIYRNKYKDMGRDNISIGLPLPFYRMYDFHAWTKVKVDSEWYNVDSCWGHSDFTASRASKTTFVDDFTMQRLHKSLKKIGGPKCKRKNNELSKNDKYSFESVKDQKRFCNYISKKYKLNKEETRILNNIIKLNYCYFEPKHQDDIKALFEKVPELKSYYYVFNDMICKRKYAEELYKKEKIDFSYTLDRLDFLPDAMPKKIEVSLIEKKDLSTEDIMKIQDLAQKGRISSILCDIDSLKEIPVDMLEECNFGVKLFTPRLSEVELSDIEEFKITEINKNGIEDFFENRKKIDAYLASSEFSDEEKKYIDVFLSIENYRDDLIENIDLGILKQVFEKVPELKNKFYVGYMNETVKIENKKKYDDEKRSGRIRIYTRFIRKITRFKTRTYISFAE